MSEHKCPKCNGSLSPVFVNDCESGLVPGNMFLGNKCYRVFECSCGYSELWRAEKW